MQLFKDHRTVAWQALQCYLIAIGCAVRRETITYKRMSEILGFDGSGVLGRQLGHIMYWCEQNNLPPLTGIVVAEKTGRPGVGFTAATDISEAHERVFEFDWYSIVPPTVRDLEDVYQARNEAA